MSRAVAQDPRVVRPSRLPHRRACALALPGKSKRGHADGIFTPPTFLTALPDRAFSFVRPHSRRTSSNVGQGLTRYSLSFLFGSLILPVAHIFLLHRRIFLLLCLRALHCVCACILALGEGVILAYALCADLIDFWGPAFRRVYFLPSGILAAAASAVAVRWVSDTGDDLCTFWDRSLDIGFGVEKRRDTHVCVWDLGVLGIWGGLG